MRENWANVWTLLDLDLLLTNGIDSLRIGPDEIGQDDKPTIQRGLLKAYRRIDAS